MDDPCGNSSSDFWLENCNKRMTENLLTIIPVVLIILVIIGGNGLVIVAVITDSHLRKLKQDWLICSLAVADFLVGLLIMPLSLTYEVLKVWPFGAILCEVWLALDVLFVTSSILHLCAISLDRYWTVTAPLTYPKGRTSRKMVSMIGISWLIALAISLPPLFIPNNTQRRGEQCSLSTDKAYVLYSALGSYWIPVVMLIVVYIRIFQITKSRMAGKIEQQKRKASAVLSTFSHENPIAYRGCTEDHDYGDKLGVPKVPRRFRNNSCPPVSVSTHLGSPAINRSKIPDRVEISIDAPSDTTESLTAKDPDPVHLYESDPLPEEEEFLSPTDKLLMQNTTISGKSAKSKSSSSFLLPSALVRAEKRFSVPPRRRRSSLLAVFRRISHSVHSRKSFGSRTSETVIDEEQSSVLENDALVQRIRRQKKQLKKKDRQATLILGAVLTAFIACWMPFFALYVLGAFGVSAEEKVFAVFFWIGYCNSAFNPIIYAVCNREFRSAFYFILCRRR